MKTLIKSILTIIPLMLFLVMNPIKTEASNVPSPSQAANSIADIIGVSGSGGSNRVVDGVTSSRTGYLVYLVDENGNVVGDTLAFKSSNFTPISGSAWIATSRKGVSVRGWESDIIPFKLPPFNSNKSTNYAGIKAWMTAPGPDGGANSVQFIYNYWGADLAKQFKEGKLVLTLETLLNFKFSYPGNKATEPPNADSIDILGYVKKLYKLPDSFSPSMEYLSSIRTLLNEILREEWEKNGGSSSSFIPVEPPIIGTVSDIARFYSISVAPNPHWFRSYTNNVACFSMMIESGGIGERFAKFKAWTGSTSSNISDEDLKIYAVATACFKAIDDEMQTTYDESKGDTPAPPARESEKSKYNIVKNYRLKEGNSYTDKGVFTLEEVSPNILIEDEQTYKVVGWKITNQKGKPDSINWESSVPGSVAEKGLSSAVVKIKDPSTTLYVLLEKEEIEEPEPIDTNYILSESSISRRIWISEPDAQLQMPYIEDYEFTWILKGHQLECSGHIYYDDCINEDNEENGENVEESENLEPEVCEGHTEYCSDFDWIDNQLKLSISNNLKDNYPDILTTKDGWRFETNQGGLVKSYFNDGVYERTNAAEVSVKESNWDYVTVIHRGKDKLTVADWKNSDSTKNNLRDVSSSGYAVANTNQGKRKVTDYIDKFNLQFVNELNGTDLYTTYGAFEAAEETGGICRTDRGAVLGNPLTINDISVKVEVYSGDKTKGKNDTSSNEASVLYFGTPGFNTSSGRMIKGTGTVSFLPYIEMKYDTLTETDKQVYVLGQYMRSLTPNSYAEINWNKQSEGNLTLISSQWSTHAGAAKYEANSVLPGGAGLGLGIKQSDRQMVEVTTYQVAVINEIKEQVELTGGSDGGLKEEAAIQAHNDYVETVRIGLENLVVQQYVDKNPNKADAFSGIKVNPGCDISSLNNGTSKASTEDKYYFREENENESNIAMQGDLDVKVEGTNTNYIKISADTSGNILMNDKVVLTKDQDYTSLSGEAKLLDDKTYIIRKVAMALERNSGDDRQANWVSDGKWYNEAMDPIYVIIQKTKITTGFVDTPERTSILDPKLIPYTENKSNMFSAFHISQFKMREHSEVYQTDFVVGMFKNYTIQMRDMDKLYFSRPFYIPNITTQDLH